MELDVEVPSWARWIVSDATDMDRAPQPVDPAALRRVRLPLPADVYFEYAFLDGERHMHADPGNPDRAENTWYPEVSCVRGPDYLTHPLSRPPSDAARGRTRRLRLDDGAGGRRRVTIYEPDGLTGPAPLLLTHDGTAYQRIARAPAVLERLIAAGRARPARLAFLDPIRPEARDREYGFGGAYQRILRDALVPQLRQEADATGGSFWLGASLGGLAGLLAALREPDQVAGVALQSPALLGRPDDPAWYGTTESWVAAELERDDGALPWRVYQEVGSLDWLHQVNRRAAEAFARRAERHRFEVRSAGHNWTFWRDGLAEALAFLLAP